MKRISGIIFWLSLILLFAVRMWAGTVQSISGDAMADLGKGWTPVKVGMKIPNGTDLMTGFDSKIVIKYGAGEFTVDELSQVTFKEKTSKNRVDNELDLKLGKVRVKYQKLQSRKETSFKVTTPRGSASVRGTEEEVLYFPDFGMKVRVLIGHVDVRSRAGMQVSVRQGGEATSGHGVTVRGTVDQITAGVQGQFGNGERAHRPSANEINHLVNGIFGGVRVHLPADLQNEPERL